MAKRRKTRNQKEQATRKVRQPATRAAQHPRPTQEKTTPVEPATQEAIIAPEQVQHRQRMQAMRTSIAVFGAIVVMQLSLWGLERMDILTLELAPF